MNPRKEMKMNVRGGPSLPAVMVAALMVLSGGAMAGATSDGDHGPTLPGEAGRHCSWRILVSYQGGDAPTGEMQCLRDRDVQSLMDGADTAHWLLGATAETACVLGVLGSEASVAAAAACGEQPPTSVPTALAPGTKPKPTIGFPDEVNDLIDRPYDVGVPPVPEERLFNAYETVQGLLPEDPSDLTGIDGDYLTPEDDPGLVGDAIEEVEEGVNQAWASLQDETVPGLVEDAEALAGQAIGAVDLPEAGGLDEMQDELEEDPLGGMESLPFEEERDGLPGTKDIYAMALQAVAQTLAEYNGGGGSDPPPPDDCEGGVTGVSVNCKPAEDWILGEVDALLGKVREKTPPPESVCGFAGETPWDADDGKGLPFCNWGVPPTPDACTVAGDEPWAGGNGKALPVCGWSPPDPCYYAKSIDQGPDGVDYGLPCGLTLPNHCDRVGPEPWGTDDETALPICKWGSPQIPGVCTVAGDEPWDTDDETTLPFCKWGSPPVPGECDYNEIVNPCSSEPCETFGASTIGATCSSAQCSGPIYDETKCGPLDTPTATVSPAISGACTGTKRPIVTGTVSSTVGGGAVIPASISGSTTVETLIAWDFGCDYAQVALAFGHGGAFRQVHVQAWYGSTWKDVDVPCAYNGIDKVGCSTAEPDGQPAVVLRDAYTGNGIAGPGGSGVDPVKMPTEVEICPNSGVVSAKALNRGSFPLTPEVKDIGNWECQRFAIHYAS